MWMTWNSLDLTVMVGSPYTIVIQIIIYIKQLTCYQILNQNQSYPKEQTLQMFNDLYIIE